MRNPILTTRRWTASVTIMLVLCSFSDAQTTWSELAHANDPHSMSTDALISIPQFITDPNATKTVPVLVILLEFSEVQHHHPVDHAVQFWDDFVFGTGGGDWTSTQPSLKQIIEEFSNGRLSITRAQETYGIQNDGIVGWVQTECNPTTYSGGYCVEGDEAGITCDPAVSGDCEAAGGHCEGCDTWEYYRFEDNKKRTEAIRLADPYIDFSQYDTMRNNWSAGSDNIVTDNEIAVLIVHAKPDCIDNHGHGDWGASADCTAGAVRYTDPTTISTDGKTLYLQPTAIPEGGTTQAMAHEFSHHVLGLGDLYNQGWGHCNPRVKTADGTTCFPCERNTDPVTAPCNDSCDDVPCLDDADIWAGAFVADGTTEGATGTDITPDYCGINDSADVWFSYTPQETGDVEVTLTSSAMDPSVAILHDCEGFSGLGCATGSPTASITVELTAGETYYIRVAGDGGATGSYSLELQHLDGMCPPRRDSTWYPEQPKAFSIMDSHQSSRVPHMSPWAKIHLGFTKPKVVDDDGTYTVYDAETIRSVATQNIEPEALVVNDWYSGFGDKRYFIIENRAPESFYDPGTIVDEGLAIWGIHEYPLPGDSDLKAKRTVRLIRPKRWTEPAEALWDGRDPDYYDLTHREITTDSPPRNTDWTDGQPSYIEITKISAAGPVMTVDVRLPGLFTDLNHPGTELGTPDYPFQTINAAVNMLFMISKDWTIRTRPGTYPENGLVIDTPCSIKPWGEGTVYIGQ